MRRSATWISFVIVLGLVCGCSFGNYPFSDEPTQVEFVEMAEALKARSERRMKAAPLFDWAWFPLVRTRQRVFGGQDNPTFPVGLKYTNASAIGPLWCVSSRRSWCLDAEQRVYEDVQVRNVLWGLYASELANVRVPNGKRVEQRATILFGIFRFAPRVNYQLEP
ncbi:MAG: hypothetical protein ACKVX7_20145 [Planctomycetota bacterium]